MAEDNQQPKISHRKKARNFLLQALYQWQMAGGSAQDIEAQFRADNQAKTDWEFFHQALVYVTANADRLDALYAPKLDREPAKLNPIERAILRLGTFEFEQRVDVPYKVVINEYVDLAKKYGATDSHKYINGVLDKVAAELRVPEVSRLKGAGAGQ